MNKLDVKDVSEIQARTLSAWDLADMFAILAKNVIAAQNAIRNTAYVFQANRHTFEQLRSTLGASGFCQCSTQLLMRNGCQCDGI